MYRKKIKKNSSKINSNLCQCLHYVSGRLNIPYNKENALFRPFYGQNAKKIVFFKWPFLAHFGTLHHLCFWVHKSRLVWPQRMFSRNFFWPKPSLLGCLRSLKKNWVKTLVYKKNDFSIFGDF